MLAREFAELDGRTVRAAAQLTKETVLAGAPARLRGVGRNGARLNARYTLTTAGANPQALVFAVGPWQLIERDTKPHQIPRQRSTRSFEGVYGHAVVPGGAVGGVHGKGGVRTRVHHPGTHGKHPWARGIVAAEPRVARLFERQTVDAIGRVF